MNVVAPVEASVAPLRVEWRPLAALASNTPQWRDLAARALEPNVFYEPAFAMPAAAIWGGNAGAALVWSRDRLLGLFPTRVENRYVFPWRVLTGWTHPYAPLGTPLVDCDEGERVIAAWLEHMADRPRAPSLLILPLVPEQGPFATAFSAALARRALAYRAFGRHRRALLAPGDDRDRYIEGAIGAKKRKELRRQRQRLADLGTLEFDHTRQASLIADALEDFLRLEASGWKGRAGSAAAGSGQLRRFLDTAVAGLAVEDKVRIDRLRVAARTIAAALTLHSGGRAFTWKIAYDEAFARTSPGVQLMLDLTQALLDDPSIVHADSCATANHPMIDHLWRERLPLADVLISLNATPKVFALACHLEGLRRSAIAAAKALRDRLKR